MKNEENLIVLFIIKTYILYTTQCTHHLNLNFSVFLSSYRNTIINQSVHVFSLSYFLKNFMQSIAFIKQLQVCSNFTRKCVFYNSVMKVCVFVTFIIQ